MLDELGQFKVAGAATFASASSANTHTFSPNTSSGIGTAAATAIAGWVITASSTCAALMFLPPRRMKSDVRPVTLR